MSGDHQARHRTHVGPPRVLSLQKLACFSQSFTIRCLAAYVSSVTASLYPLHRKRESQEQAERLKNVGLIVGNEQTSSHIITTAQPTTAPARCPAALARGNNAVGAGVPDGAGQAADRQGLVEPAEEPGGRGGVGTHGPRQGRGHLRSLRPVRAAVAHGRMAGLSEK